MRFLVTGNYKNSSPFKRIVLFTYLLFIFFVIGNLILELIHTPFKYEEFQTVLEPSLILSLEKFHEKLFLFGIEFLFLFSFIFHIDIKEKKRSLLFFGSIIFFSSYIFIQILISETVIFFYFYWIVLISFHIWNLFLIIYLFIKLHF